MWTVIAKAKKTLWAFVELGFLAVLAIILISLLLGESAGSYVNSVTANVTKFAAGAHSGVLGIVIVLGILYLVLQRGGWSPSNPAGSSRSERGATKTRG
jgi:ABC-type dipeptide/oligopeptide/nickel transport system permease component